MNNIASNNMNMRKCKKKMKKKRNVLQTGPIIKKLQ